VIETQVLTQKEKPQPGLVGEARVAVDERNTAIGMRSGTVPVFATPALAALMEEAAVAALTGVLDEGRTSVGTHLDLQHLAATPVGMTVRAEARLMTIDGRRLIFRITAHDGVEQVGQATHQRMIVDLDRFLSRTEAKLAR
jgi:predicted thioesterase